MQFHISSYKKNLEILTKNYHFKKTCQKNVNVYVFLDRLLYLKVKQSEKLISKTGGAVCKSLKFNRLCKENKRFDL